MVNGNSSDQILENLLNNLVVKINYCLCEIMKSGLLILRVRGSYLR